MAKSISAKIPEFKERYTHIQGLVRGIGNGTTLAELGGEVERNPVELMRWREEKTGYTVLMALVVNRQWKLVGTLLDNTYKSNNSFAASAINNKNRKGQTALDIAPTSDMAELLAHYGARYGNSEMLRAAPEGFVPGSEPIDLIDGTETNRHKSCEEERVPPVSTKVREYLRVTREKL